MKAAGLAIALMVAVAACSGKTAEDRAREAEEAIKKQMADPRAAALEQQVSAETVKEVQAQLQALHEYLGEVNGVLDSVTVNAVQAFQTAQGLEADGILTEKTKRRLREAAAHKKAEAGRAG